MRRSIKRVAKEISRMIPQFKNSEAENFTLRESTIRQGRRTLVIRFEREVLKFLSTIFSFTAIKPVMTSRASFMDTFISSIEFSVRPHGFAATI